MKDNIEAQIEVIVPLKGEPEVNVQAGEPSRFLL